MRSVTLNKPNIKKGISSEAAGEKHDSSCDHTSSSSHVLLPKSNFEALRVVAPKCLEVPR